MKIIEYCIKLKHDINIYTDEVHFVFSPFLLPINSSVGCKRGSGYKKHTLPRAEWYVIRILKEANARSKPTLLYKLMPLTEM